MGSGWVGPYNPGPMRSRVNLEAMWLMNSFDHEKESHWPNAAANKGGPNHRMEHRLPAQACIAAVEEVDALAFWRASKTNTVAGVLGALRGAPVYGWRL